MEITDNKDFYSKIGMGIFLVFIILFVTLSSWIYFNNNTNVAIKIQTDNQVNREKTAINEALTKTILLKNDTIVSYKTEVKRKDSFLYKKVEQFEKKLKKSEIENDSLKEILRKLKQSDLQPINRKESN